MTDHVQPKTIEEAIAQRDGWVEAARNYCHGQTYFREVLEEIGEIIGRDAYTADDGSISDSVLVAKLPDVIRERLKVKARPYESYL